MLTLEAPINTAMSMSIGTTQQYEDEDKFGFVIVITRKIRLKKPSHLDYKDVPNRTLSPLAASMTLNKPQL